MAMVRYCPHFWREVTPTAERCPNCGQLVDDSDRPFIDRLLSTLRHPEPTRAGLAIDLLAGRLHEPRAVGPLVELLAESHDASILIQAARGLGKLGDRQAVPALARLLADRDQAFVARRAAAWALGELGGPEAEIALHAAARDERPSVAEAARQALAALGGKRVAGTGGRRD
jgi:HEAT repeat protein